MKTTVARRDLDDAVTRLLPAVAKKPAEPIISMIYLDAKDNRLTMRATNFAQEVKVTIPANVEVSGKVCVVGKYLQQIIAKLSGEIVTLSEEDNRLLVKSDAARFELFVADAEDFPAESRVAPDCSLRLNAGAFGAALRRTVFCAGKDATRAILTGVKVKLSGEEAELVATNAHRLGLVRLTAFDPIEGEREFVLPAEACWALISSLGKSLGQVVTLRAGANRVSFEFDDELFTTTIIDGQFPPTDKLFDEPKSVTAEVELPDLLAALERVMIVASTNDYQSVTLEFTEEGLALKSSSQGIGSVIEHVDADLTGGAITTSMNIRYLQETLKALTTRRCRFGLEAELIPISLVGVGDDSAEYLITPVRVR